MSTEAGYRAVYCLLRHRLISPVHIIPGCCDVNFRPIECLLWAVKFWIVVTQNVTKKLRLQWKTSVGIRFFHVCKCAR